MVERINDIYFTHEEIKTILKHYGEVIRDTAPWNDYEEKIPYECYRRLMKECVKGVRLIENIDNNYYFYDDDEEKYQEAKEYFAESPRGARAIRITTAPTEPLIMIMESGHDFCDFLRNYYLVYRPDWYAPRKEEKKEEDKGMAILNSNIWYNNSSTSNSSLVYNSDDNEKSNCVWTTTTTPNHITDWISVKDDLNVVIDNVNVLDSLKGLAGAVQTATGAISNIGNEINKLNNQNEKENKKMKGFNFDFGPCTTDNVKMSMYGIAVKNQAGEWVSYNPATAQIVNVDIFNFDGGKYMFKMPVAPSQIAAGDVIVHNKKAMFVLDKDENGFVVVDPHAGEEKKVVPTSNCFNFNFVTKIVSMFDAFAAAPTPDAPFGNMLPFLMMDGGKDIDPMMMMFMMNGGNMGDMFNNPMMMYFLMKDSGKDNMLPLMMMMGQGCGHNCKCGK